MRLHGKQGLRPHRLAQRGTAPGRRRSHRPSMASTQCVGCLGKGVIRPASQPALGSDVPVRRCDSTSTDGHGCKIPPPLAQEEPACPPRHVDGAARAREKGDWQILIPRRARRPPRRVVLFLWAETNCKCKPRRGQQGRAASVFRWRGCLRAVSCEVRTVDCPPRCASPRGALQRQLTACQAWRATGGAACLPYGTAGVSRLPNLEGKVPMGCVLRALLHVR